MTGEERLKALRSIRGMWKGKAKEIMQRLAAPGTAYLIDDNVKRVAPSRILHDLIPVRMPLATASTKMRRHKCRRHDRRRGGKRFARLGIVWMTIAVFEYRGGAVRPEARPGRACVLPSGEMPETIPLRGGICKNSQNTF